ncbi:protein RGF1 INDUCIBLE TRANSCRIPTION FACTOR 1-like isoform X2 [Rhodamnia argentea]|uniref:Protein RGF1 INDUCIBLE TRANSCRIPTION FACTOR 1-like isoform X2 n=1 Tax=Rhodamnia argentea TaxID=178133 RepID=A0ABM3HLA4_9MYRT|nr:protein RGF1 INDUCIBLE TRANSCRIPTION FACTOR 1-like isoform X2 [Rhodamnia argentea]
MRGRKVSSPEGKKRPDWLGDLLQCGFFSQCSRHCEMPRSEQRLYCLDCNLAICKHCAANDHGRHPRLHILKYKCDNAVRVQDMRSYFNCSEIKSYIINEDKVVLISPRSPPETSEQPKNCRSCAACGVSIQRSSETYCSIACKVSLEPADQQERAADEGSRKESSTITLHDGKEGSCSSPEDGRDARSDEPRRSFRPRHRLLKRKGIPRRAPLF